jgi:hypothetical protein
MRPELDRQSRSGSALARSRSVYARNVRLWLSLVWVVIALGGLVLVAETFVSGDATFRPPATFEAT